MTGRPISVDYLAETLDGLLLRFVGDRACVAVLRDAFDALAAGQSPNFAFVSGLNIAFHVGERAGAEHSDGGAFRYGGSPDQWHERARILDPLTEPSEGWNYLDNDGVGEIGVVVSTYPDGGF